MGAEGDTIKEAQQPDTRQIPARYPPCVRYPQPDTRSVKRLSFTHPGISFPHTTAFCGERECITEKLALVLDCQVECGLAAERKASCELFNSSFVYLP